MFETACVLVCAMQIFNMWLMGRGTINYPVVVAVYALYLMIETYLASQTSWVVLLFNVCNTWGIYNAVRGWYRHGPVLNGGSRGVSKSVELDKR